MGSVSIEAYTHRIESYIADVLKNDPRISEFRPEEKLPPGERTGTKVSDVVGAASLIIAGFGWHSRRLPTTILEFHSCPIIYGTFTRDSYSIKTRLFFPIPSRCEPKKWGSSNGEMTLSGKGLGMLGTGRAIELSVRRWAGQRTPGFDNVKADSNLTQTILQLMQTGLIRIDVIHLKYKKEGAQAPFGMVELEIGRDYKEWRKTIDRDRTDPQDFVVGLFLAMVSVVRHIQNDLQGSTAVTISPYRQAEPPLPTVKYCVNCGTSMPVDANYCGKCGASQS